MIHNPMPLLLLPAPPPPAQQQEQQQPRQPPPPPQQRPQERGGTLAARNAAAVALAKAGDHASAASAFRSLLRHALAGGVTHRELHTTVRLNFAASLLALGDHAAALGQAEDCLGALDRDRGAGLAPPPLSHPAHARARACARAAHCSAWGEPTRPSGRSTWDWRRGSSRRGRQRGARRGGGRGGGRSSGSGRRGRCPPALPPCKPTGPPSPSS